MKTEKSKPRYKIDFLDLKLEKIRKQPRQQKMSPVKDEFKEKIRREFLEVYEESHGHFGELRAVVLELFYELNNLDEENEEDKNKFKLFKSNLNVVEYLVYYDLPVDYEEYRKDLVSLLLRGH